MTEKDVGDAETIGELVRVLAYPKFELTVAGKSRIPILSPEALRQDIVARFESTRERPARSE